jgi:hypothetical protein
VAEHQVIKIRDLECGVHQAERTGQLCQAMSSSLITDMTPSPIRI